MIRIAKARRSFVIIAVLVIVGSALLVATALLFQAQADVASAARSVRIAQSRALAWSGLQAVMVRLHEQRERILAGQMPQLDREYQIYETALELGMVRILHSGPEGGLLVPEAGKLDLNSATAESLVGTGLVTPDVAAAIVDYRSRQPGGRFQSVADILRTPGSGLTAQSLYGPIAEISTRDSAGMAALDLAERVQARLSDAHVRGLADILTVYSFEPAVQRSGSRRINLNVPWSDDLQQKIADRFGEEAAAMAKQAFQGGERFDSEARLFQVLRQFQTPPENWPPLLDTFTTDEGALHYGRLDINTAPYEAIRGLPGITPEIAAQLVRVRDDLSVDERSTIAWPGVSQVISPEQYDVLAGRITTRCWTYRLRLAAGMVAASAPEGELQARVVYEAVIDLASETPRIAYLRDISTLQSAAQVFAAASDRAPLASDEFLLSELPLQGENALLAPDSIEDVEPHSDESRLTDPPDVQLRDEPENNRGSKEPLTARDARRIGRWQTGD